MTKYFSSVTDLLDSSLSMVNQTFISPLDPDLLQALILSMQCFLKPLSHCGNSLQIILPVAIRTKLDWCVCGPNKTLTRKTKDSQVIIFTNVHPIVFIVKLEEQCLMFTNLMLTCNCCRIKKDRRKSSALCRKSGDFKYPRR